MEEEASYSTLRIREETTPTLDTAQPPSPSPVTDVVTNGLSTRSIGTENIEHHPLDAIGVEHTAVGHTPSGDRNSLFTFSYSGPRRFSLNWYAVTFRLI